MTFVREFNYTGSVQTLELGPGIYRYEVYGAQGAGSGAGAGGRSFGTHTITSNTTLNIYVGGQNGWNGGGAAGRVTGVSSYVNYGCNGGGASDIRIGGTSLDNRIIVAGGGGGGGYAGSGGFGGAGGGLSGGNGTDNTNPVSTGATQTSGYAKGQGGAGHEEASYRSNSSGGGGGYWGGNAGGGYGGSKSGAGGSGYVDPVLTDANTVAGGRSGNGYIKVYILKYIPYTAYVNNKTICCDKIVNDINEGVVVNKLAMSIDGVESNVIESPEDNPRIIIDVDSCSFGIHNIEVTADYTDPDGGTGSYTYNLKFVKYGEGVTANIPLADIPFYIGAIKTQIVDVKNNLKNILIENGFEVVENTKLTDMIKIVESMSNNNNTTVNEYISQINTLQTQIHELNAELAGKVDPAGTAVAGDVLSGKTFINSTGKTVTGTMANRGGAQTVTPGTSNKTLNAGYYSGNITVAGDANLIAANIVSGKNIFGVAGTATASSLGGRRYATGITKSSSSTIAFVDYLVSPPSYAYYITVSGLSFKPSYIYAHCESYYVTTWSTDRPPILTTTVYDAHFISLDGTSAYVTSTGFRLPVFIDGGNVTWFAIE